MMRNRCSIVIIIVCFVMSSCRTGIEIHQALRKDKEIKELSLESVNNKKKFEKYLKLEGANVILNIDKIEERFNAGIAIIRDELMIISIVPVAGIEAIRIYCTKDSIIVLKRKEKEYYSASYKEIMSGYNLQMNYNNLVAICANEFFIYGKEKEDIYNIDYEYINNGTVHAKYTNSTQEKNKMQQKVIYDVNNGTIKEMIIDDERNNMRMTINYTDFVQIEKAFFPEKISFKIVSGKNTLSVKIDIRKIRAEETVNKIIEIPSQYSRIQL